MSDGVILYTNPMSRGRIARWMLEETGIPYETRVLGYAGAMKTPDYLAINPMGKVPALVHGAVVVTECAAICAYLADAFPAAGLAPDPRDPLRGAYYRWLFFGAGPVEQAVTDRALGLQVPADKRVMVGYGSYDAMLDGLEGAVSAGAYLLGDRFSAADVYLGSQIGWGLQFGTLEKRPAFETYWARLAARPAHVRATELDDADMAAAS
ncbi:glutathione S-transferase family protein [Zavarzinia compransoris]|uniref:glutathione S-transferase family protein n=1 Tax=Zavarzinia marina TaxID=2911065 RepID=UPI001F3A48B3|nr:glutathione S-transferase family protein [Zavarzinia marina]MCF4166560.1 glutathione S-transferase family protein [Zavarzinia marina]